MAEPLKNKKPTLRQLLEDIADDDEFSEEDRRLAKEKSLEIEYQRWSARIEKSTSKPA